MPNQPVKAQWQARHGALIALASIGETIPDDPAQRSAVIAPAVSALSDSHPRVRWAATHAVGQLASDLAPMLQVRDESKPVLPTTVTHPSCESVSFSQFCSNP